MAKALINLGADLRVENLYGTLLHNAAFRLNDVASGRNLDVVKLMCKKYPEMSIYFHNKPYTYMCCNKKNHAIINITMNNFVKQTEIMPVQFNEQCKMIKHTGNKHTQPYCIKKLLHYNDYHPHNT